MATIAAFTTGLYLLASILLWVAIRYSSLARWLWRVPSLLALLLHGYLLFIWIDHGHLQNLSWPNMTSMTLWVAGVLVWTFSLSKPVENLTFLIFPLSLGSILLCLKWPYTAWMDTGANVELLMHLLLVILALSTWWITLAQAILVGLQNHLLRRQSDWQWLQWLPPLETMEELLFKFIQVSFIILTLILFSAVWLVPISAWAYIIPKTILGGLAWILYGTLLVGHYRFGWHGKIAVRGTLVGFIFLLLAYVGSQIIN